MRLPDGVGIARRWLGVGGRYWTHARLLWGACPGRSLVALAVTVASAGLATFALIATGQFIGALPAAAHDGGGSAAAAAMWRWLAWTALALIGQPVLGALTGWVRAMVSARYLAYVSDLVAEAGTFPRGIAHLDAPGLSGRLQAVVQSTRDWTFVFGVDATWEVLQLRLSGIGAFGVLLSWRWWIPFVITAAYIVQSKIFVSWIDMVFDDLFDVSSRERRMTMYLRRLLTGVDAAKELRLFGLAGWLVSRYATMWRAEMAAIWRSRTRGLAPILWSCLGMAVAIGGALALLAHDATTGLVGLAAVITLVQAMLALESFGILGDTQTSLARNTTATTQLAAVRTDLGLPALTPDHPAGLPASPATEPSATGPSRVDLDGVTFGYPTRDRATVRELGLHIPAGQSIALVGANGAGKSTLIKLLCGLYAPDAGTVRVDGRDPFTDEQARRRVAVIFQDFVHYPLSLRDNVGFGALERRDEPDVVRRALAEAGADGLEREHGWDTMLSAAYPGGTDLSGGQWQRIALARAMAAVAGGAGVLVLDEPTAALDVRAEAALFDRFLSVTRGVTTILVSHRLSSVRHADRIVVLDEAPGPAGVPHTAIDGSQGAIVEDGTHEELMAARGRYAEMFTLQARRFAQSGSSASVAAGPGPDGV